MLGFPLPALAAMQEAGVQLGQACWGVKQSTSGISVSFFWPQNSHTQLNSTQKITKSKKRRHRCKSKDKTNDITKNKHPDVDLDQLQSHDQDIPIDAHTIPESAKSPTPVMLADADQVVVKGHIDINVDDDYNIYYLERSDIPGVCVESGGTSSWTPSTTNEPECDEQFEPKKYHQQFQSQIQALHVLVGSLVTCSHPKKYCHHHCHYLLLSLDS